MMSAVYSDVDRLILDRWDEVCALVEAQRALQDKIEQALAIARQRVSRWAEPQGYVIDAAPRDAEIYAWPVGWRTRSAATARVS
jgi:hypothetical protein